MRVTVTPSAGSLVAGMTIQMPGSMWMPVAGWIVTSEICCR